MVKLKTRRYQRYAQLRPPNNWFLPFEARWLSRVPFGLCPYMKDIKKDRRELMARTRAEAKAQGKKLTSWDWEKIIKNLYKKSDWCRLDRRDHLMYDPYRLLKDYEERHRQKNPQYESPWEARGRKWKDFIDRYERTVARQTGVA